MKRAIVAGVLAAAVGCGGDLPPPPVKHDPKYDQPQPPPPKGQRPTMG